MREILFLGSVAAIYLPLLLSPGPNFLVLTRIAATESRRHGMVTSLGITSASTLYATFAVTGVGVLVAQSSRVQMVLQFAGGAYLLYKGLAMMRRAAPLPVASAVAGGRQDLPRAYREGLLTNLTNPQGLLFFTSIFATLMPANLQLWAKPASVVLVAALSISVNLATVTLFSLSGVQQRYLLAKIWIDRVTGFLLGSFGIRLLRMMWQ